MRHTPGLVSTGLHLQCGVIVRGPVLHPPSSSLWRAAALFSFTLSFGHPSLSGLFCRCVNTAESEALTCRPAEPSATGLLRPYTHVRLGDYVCTSESLCELTHLNPAACVFLHLNVNASHCLNICLLLNADEFAQCCVFVCSGGKCGGFNNAAHCWLVRLYGTAFRL